MRQLKKEILVNTLKVPMDVCMGAIRITIIGNCEARIENYKGILSYSEEEIKLQGKGTILQIKGKELTLLYYTAVDMKISGEILEVSYL